MRFPVLAGSVAVESATSSCSLAVALAAVAATTVVGYSALELARFARAELARSTVVYASGQSLSPGTHVGQVGLATTLAHLGYVETRMRPTEPGQFQRNAPGWEIVLRGQEETGIARGGRLRLVTEGDRITRVLRDGRDVGSAALESEVLTGGGVRPGEEYRPLRLSETPPVLVNAVLAAEDRRFFEHGPVDLLSLVRAAWTNVRSGRVAQGGSTITQQLVKGRLLTPQRTMLRKVQEAWLALLVEYRYPKNQILEAYLNEIYLGQRDSQAIRGMGAAARAYFGKEVHQLSTGEAAVLAGMVRGPNTYSPAADIGRSRARRDAVLARMREVGLIGVEEYNRARNEPVRVVAWSASGPSAPYFVDSVRQEIEQRFDESALRSQANVRDRDEPRSGPPAICRAGGSAGARSARDDDTPAPANEGVSRTAGGTGGDRSRHRRDPGPRRRPRLPDQPVQPRAHGAPPARLSVQALRVRGGAPPEERTAPVHGGVDHRRFAGDDPGVDRVLDAAQLRRPIRGSGDRAARARAVAQHRHRSDRAGDGPRRRPRDRSVVRAGRQPDAPCRPSRSARSR